MLGGRGRARRVHPPERAARQHLDRARRHDARRRGGRPPSFQHRRRADRSRRIRWCANCSRTSTGQLAFLPFARAPRRRRSGAIISSKCRDRFLCSFQAEPGEDHHARSIARARALFEKQIDCIVTDDRKAQAKLYADDLLYEFPFATDRPRRIEGRDAFLAVMQPLWQQARQRHIKVVGCREQIHETADPDFIVAEFAFDVEIDGQDRRGAVRSVLQGSRRQDRGGPRVFQPAARSEALGQG